MPSYLTPGVYVEEIKGGTQPIEGVGTSTAGFVGTGGRTDVPVGEPIAVSNWSQYVTDFLGTGPMTPLSHAVNGFFVNGGQRCYVMDVGDDSALAGTARRPGLSALEEIDEIAIVAAPGFTGPAAYEAVLAHCEKMRDRVAILDTPRDVPNIMDLTMVATLDAGPDPGDSPPADAAPVGPGGAAPVGGGPSGGAAAGLSAAAPARRTGGRAVPSAPRSSSRGTLYYPWLKVTDLVTREVVSVPPSGHVAGIWARTDALRGVHKAPANEPVRGALGLQRRVTPAEQGELNSAGVNVLRFFTGQGIRVWGARTLARDSEPEWRYLNVRRLFSMVEESIIRGTSWIVFEPNDRPLWNMIRRDVSAFCTRLWRDGALVGRTPSEAFFVKCDKETNPDDVVDAGQVVAIVGMAPVKPAEFIVFKVCQFAGGSAVEQEGGSRG